MMDTFPERLANLQPFWGSWMLDAYIGKGSYGQVFRIKKEDALGNKQFAALKWLCVPQDTSEIRKKRNSGYTDQQIQENYTDIANGMRREIETMQKLVNNPHIVRCDDYDIVARQGEPGWDILIRMELLTPLNDYFAKGMTVRNVLTLGVDICDALSFCETNNIIHRDIKPENIFIDNSGYFKLGDFGVAKQIEMTSSGLSKQGTPLYMAPEVYNNTAKNDHTVDLYSLGLVLHELLNRQRVPFVSLSNRMPTGSDRDKAFAARMKGLPLPPPVDGGVSLARVISKACEYQPEKRYRTAAEMRIALENSRKKSDIDAVLTANPVEGVGLNSKRSHPMISGMPNDDNIKTMKLDEVARGPQVAQKPGTKNSKIPRLLIILIFTGIVILLLGFVQMVKSFGTLSPKENIYPQETVLLTSTNIVTPIFTHTSSSTPTPSPTPSPTLTVTSTYTPISKISDLVIAVTGTKSIRISWTENNTGAFLYTVSYKTNGDTAYKTAVSTNNTYYNLLDLLPGTQYFISISTDNGNVMNKTVTMPASPTPTPTPTPTPISLPTPTPSPYETAVETAPQLVALADVYFLSRRSLDVYSAPNDGSYRDNHALVTTNYPVTIYGVVDDWVLVSYAIGYNNLRGRVGYIANTALNYPESVQLNFIELPMVVQETVSATDDPNYGQAELFVISQGDTVTLLAFMGDDWAYVETVYQGKQCRVFIPRSALYEKVRYNGKVISMSVLIICGVNSEGKREVLCAEPMLEESKATYSNLFNQLKSRGLQTPSLIVLDAHVGVGLCHWRKLSWRFMATL